MKFVNAFVVLIFSVIVFSTSCRKDELLTDSSAMLEFSRDSVLFDTVFTTVGSTTKVFMIYNKHNKPLKISRISLAGGATSQFRVNVDGVSGYSIGDIEIMGGDSLFVFVQVTVNPLNSNSPLLVTEELYFETNGNTQTVYLTAVGQDVHLHRPNLPANKPWYSIIGCNEVWTNDKPHLIFGYAVVDSFCKLTIMPGTRVHFSNSGNLLVYRAGTLEVKGAYGNEVRFEGSRLEPTYKDVPGQWGKIYLSPLCNSSSIDWAIIKNGGIGVHADTVAANGIPTLKMSNTIIKNMQAAAIYARGSHIWANNCVFANCGQYIAALTIGGKYRFEHCTFANYWDESTRTTPVLALNNHYISGNFDIVRDLDSAYFKNCILEGNIAEEVGMDSALVPGFFNYKFEHCLIRTERSVANSVHYFNSHRNISPDFKNAAANNYELNDNSFAKDKGTATFISKDLKNNDRPFSATSIPDLGAYENQSP